MASSAGIFVEPHTNNVGIGTTNPMGIFHANTLVVKNDGKIGIGTTTPVRTFDIYNTEIGVTNSIGAGLITANGNGLNIFGNASYTPATSGAGWSSIPDMVVKAGLVGVGTTNPRARFDVNGSFFASGSIVQCVFRNTLTNTNCPAPTASSGQTTAYQAGPWTATDVYATITPKFATSKLLIQASVATTMSKGSATSYGCLLQVRRDGVEDTVSGTTGQSTYTTYPNLLIHTYAEDSVWHKPMVQAIYTAGNTNATTFKIYGAAWRQTTTITVGGHYGYGASEVTIFEIAQ
jgi:hypothetical protein